MKYFFKNRLLRSHKKRHTGRPLTIRARVGTLLLSLLLLSLAACAAGTSGNQDTHRQTVQTNSGETITYSTQPQDVLLRLFYGGGKVGSLELTPEASLYGDGTFLLGPGLQVQKGALSSDALQALLQALTDTDGLLKLHQQVFNDIPSQNTTLLQVALNNKKYQFVYGPFGNLQESAQEMQEYKQLGNAIGRIKDALSGPETAYTSQNQVLLVYQTSRLDFTTAKSWTLPRWSVDDISLADTAAYECGLITPDPNNPRPNLDNGCLTYTVPLVAYQPGQQDLQTIAGLLGNQQQSMFVEDGYYYVVMLRPLLPDEITRQQLAMYGSAVQTYTPVPLKSGAIPVPTPTQS